MWGWGRGGRGARLYVGVKEDIGLMKRNATAMHAVVADQTWDVAVIWEILVTV